VLAARFVSTGAPFVLLRRRIATIGRGVTLLTWGGIRGDISIALALSLHDRSAQFGLVTTDLIVLMTYAIVVFSVHVQDLTLAPLVRRMPRARTAEIARTSATDDRRLYEPGGGAVCT